MSDFARLEQALQAANDAGDVAAAQQLATAMRQQLQRSNPQLGMPDPVKLGQAGMPASIREVVPEFSRGAQVAAGIGSAGMIAKEGIAGLLGQTDQENEQNWKGVQQATPYTQGGNIGGNAMLFAAGPTRLGGEVSSIVSNKAPAWMGSRTGMAADTGATSAVLNAAATPGSVQERFGAGLMAGGTALATPATYALGAAARRETTRAGKRLSVGEGLQAELGDDGAQRLAAALSGKDQGMDLGVASTAAMRTQNPTLEALESGSRTSRSDLWREFDRQNASARWNTLTGRAGTPDELSLLKADRAMKTGPLRDDAIASATTIAGMSNPGTPLRSIGEKIEEIRIGKSRPNPDAQRLADYVEGEIAKGVSPEQLYEVRKFLTDGVKAGRTDELSNAVKAARVERMEFVRLIDDAIDDLSGGGWKDYLRSYAAQSKPVTSKQALQDMVTALKRGQPEGAVPTSMGESAAWKTVGNLRDRFGSKEVGGQLFDRMLPEDRTLVNALVENLKRQSDVMSAKATLGSPTAPLLANAGRANNITQNAMAHAAETVLPFGGAMTAKVFDMTGRKAEEELARLLQDPYALSEAISGAARAQALAKGMSKTGAATGAATTK